MSRTSAWAALYFIALMTFGNYVLFNLLVAILVEGFSSEVPVSSSSSSSSSYFIHKYIVTDIVNKTKTGSQKILRSSELAACDY